MPLNKNTTESWEKLSRGWPVITDFAHSKYVLAARGIIPYGTYVLCDDGLRVETQELMDKLNNDYQLVIGAYQNDIGNKEYYDRVYIGQLQKLIVKNIEKLVELQMRSGITQQHKRMMNKFSCAMIRASLVFYGGKKSTAAFALGINRATLKNTLKRD